MPNQSVTNIANAIINKINSLISSHNSNGSAHSDIRNSIPSKTSDLTNDSGFLTSHQNITGKEDKSNKVTSLSSSSTDTEYPSAKCVYDELESLFEDTIDELIEYGESL